MKIIKSLNWIGYITIFLSSFFLGVIVAQYISVADLDAEISGLLGGAMGAAITVAGAVWLARYQDSKDKRAFIRLITDSITAIRDEAYILICFCEVDISDNHEAIGQGCAEQIERITEAFSLFENHMGMGSIQDYETQLWIYRLEREIQKSLKTFEKESGWLNGTLSSAVVKNAQRDLLNAANSIFEGCVGAHRELKQRVPLPSDDELKRLGL